MVGEGLAPPVLTEFRLWRRFARPALDKRACRSSGGEMRCNDKVIAREFGLQILPTGFGVQGGANKIKRYKPLSPEKERRAGSQRVAPPENEKSTPLGVLRSLARVDKKRCRFIFHRQVRFYFF